MYTLLNNAKQSIWSNQKNFYKVNTFNIAVKMNKKIIKITKIKFINQMIIFILTNIDMFYRVLDIAFNNTN